MDNKELIEATECPTNVEELVAYIEQQRHHRLPIERKAEA